MTATHECSAEPETTLTRAVRTWMGHKTIARFVWDELAHREKPASPTYPPLNKRGKLLLATLTYAYAVGVYRSREIEEEIFRSAAGRQFFSLVPVTAQSLRYFRRTNRELIKDCLCHVLFRALKAQGNRPRAIGCDTQSREWPTAVGDSVCEPIAQVESARRLDAAATSDLIDSES